MQEDYFETDDYDDISELVSKTESSAKEWHEEDVEVDKIKDVNVLHEIIRQKDSKLLLSAEIGSKLLQRERKLHESNLNLQLNIHSLEDEVKQLQHEKRCLAEHKGEGEEMLKTLLQRSNSTRQERSKRLHQQVKLLRSDLSHIIDDMAVLQLHVQKEVDEVRTVFKDEFAGASREVAALEKKVEWVGSRFATFDTETSGLKKSLHKLTLHCLSQESNIEDLSQQLVEIKRGKEEEIKAVGELVDENEGLKRILSGLRNRLKVMERGRLPKVLRHVNDTTSPYIDSQSLAYELDQTPTGGSYKPLGHKKFSLQPPSYYANYFNNSNNTANFNNINNNSFDQSTMHPMLPSHESTCLHGCNLTTHNDTICHCGKTGCVTAIGDNVVEAGHAVDVSDVGFKSLLPQEPSYNLSISSDDVKLLLKGFRRYMEGRKLGQPGRPGSGDLDVAMGTLTLKHALLQRCNEYNKSNIKSFSHAEHDRCYIKYNNNHKNEKINNDNVTGLNSIFTQSLCYDRYATCSSSHHYDTFSNHSTAKLPNQPLNNPSVHHKQQTEDNGSFVTPPTPPSQASLPENPHTDSPSLQGHSSQHLTATTRSSRLIDRWASLWQCSMEDALRGRSGVWIKGSWCNDHFIEEDFSKMDDDGLLGYGSLTDYGSLGNLCENGSRVDLTEAGRRSNVGSCDNLYNFSVSKSNITSTHSTSTQNLSHSTLQSDSITRKISTSRLLSRCNDSGVGTEIDDVSFHHTPVSGAQSSTSNLYSVLYSRETYISTSITDVSHQSHQTRPCRATRPSFLSSNSSRQHYLSKSSTLKRAIFATQSSKPNHLSPLSFSMDDLSCLLMPPINSPSHKHSTSNNFLDSNNNNTPSNNDSFDNSNNALTTPSNHNCLRLYSCDNITL